MSDTTSPPVYTRRAFTRDNGKGESCAEWTLSCSKITDPVQIVAQPIYTVPVIFVPGIMGSNLKVKAAADGLDPGQAVWLMNGQMDAAQAWGTKSAMQRQLRLNPLNTEVTGEGDVPKKVPTIGDADAIRKLRYWGEVGAMSYESFLVWLEKILNEKGRVNHWRGQLGQPAHAASIFKGLAFPELKEAAVGHVADIRFPVYACGYNWLQSNLDSATRLKRRIQDVIKANNSKSYTCHKVILVTHSMGGLVARACSELLGMQDQIAGIVHGVMPATGAAAAYKRVRSGTEGKAGVVLGVDAAEVTAVFANSPGALQLLPSKDYGPGWLQLGSGVGAAFKPSLSLPLADPYEEIYKKKGPWWALVREELINPAVMEGHLGWTDYIKNITDAQKFHEKLGNKYHPNTVAFYGNGRDGSNGLTWGTVRWQAYSATDIKPVWGQVRKTAEVLGSLQPNDFLLSPGDFDSGEGRVGMVAQGRQRILLDMSGKDSAGDGTVPERSGKAPAQGGAKLVYHLNLDAEGHEGAYRVPLAQQVTLHAILSIAKGIPVVI